MQLADVNANVTTISGGKITTGSITADKLSVTTLSSITATLGTITSGAIYGTRFYVGGGTNEDIYFMDSGIRFYDAGGNTINLYKSGYKYVQFALGSTAGIFSSDGKIQIIGGGNIELFASSQIFYFKTNGVIKLPILSSAPSGVAGDFCRETSKLHIYYNGWRYINSDSGW